MDRPVPTSATVSSPHQGDSSTEPPGDVARHEAEVLRVRDEWERTFEAVPDLIAILDASHRVVRVNRAMAERMGTSPEDAVGRPCYEAVHNLSHPPDDCPHEKLIEDGREHVAEVYEPRLGGHFLVSVSPLHDAQGQLSGCVHVARDITARKQAEDELRRHRDNLEAVVHERTAALIAANEQLTREVTVRRQAEAERIRYQERLRSLAAELSLAEQRERRHLASALHDNLGQLLAFASIKLHSLEHSPTPAAASDEVAHLRRLIEQAQAYTSSLTFELSPPILYDLGFEAAVEWLADLFQREHGLSVRVEDDALPKRLEDDVRATLFQAVRELLTNVVKHARASSARVSLARGEGEIRVEVEDDGVGFDPSAPERHERRGSGFGLFSLRERLSYIGGSLQLDSRPGEGTRVTLIAPVPPADAALVLQPCFVL